MNILGGEGSAANSRSKVLTAFTFFLCLTLGFIFGPQGNIITLGIHINQCKNKPAQDGHEIFN